MMGANLSVLACGSPIKFERTKVISRISLRMLLPIRISIPESVGPLVVLMFDGGEELTYNPFFAPVPQVVNEKPGDNQQHQSRDCVCASALLDAGIVFFRLEDRHISK